MTLFKLSDILKSILIEANPTIPADKLEALVKKYDNGTLTSVPK